VPALHVLGGHRVPFPRAHRLPPEPQAVRVLVLRVPFQLALGHHQAYPVEVGAERRLGGIDGHSQLAPRRQGADDGRDGPPELQQVQPVPDGDGNGHRRRRGQGGRRRLRGRQGRDQQEGHWRRRGPKEKDGRHGRHGQQWPGAVDGQGADDGQDADDGRRAVQKGKDVPQSAVAAAAGAAAAGQRGHPFADPVVVVVSDHDERRKP